MLVEKIHIILSLSAALIMAIVGLVMRMSLYDISICVMLVIVVFLILGLILRAMLRKNKPPAGEDAQTNADADR